MIWVKLFAIAIGVLLTSVLTKAAFRRWPQTGKWAITSGATPCPVCGVVPTPVRIPSDFHEMLWGGNTCARCGTAFDKHGKERVR